MATIIYLIYRQVGNDNIIYSTITVGFDEIHVYLLPSLISKLSDAKRIIQIRQLISQPKTPYLDNGPARTQYIFCGSNSVAVNTNKQTYKTNSS